MYMFIVCVCEIVFKENFGPADYKNEPAPKIGDIK